MTTESTTFLRHIQLRILLNYRDLLIKLVDKVENKELFNNFSFFYDRLLNRGRRKIEKGLLEDFLIEIENNNNISDIAKEKINDMIIIIKNFHKDNINDCFKIMRDRSLCSFYLNKRNIYVKRRIRRSKHK